MWNKPPVKLPPLGKKLEVLDDGVLKRATWTSRGFMLWGFMVYLRHVSAWRET